MVKHNQPFNASSLKKHTVPILLVLIFVVALAFRFLHFPQNIYFGYDQARDAYESQRIYNDRDLTLLGPRTEVDGVFHSPLYYYIIGPLYLFSEGQPYLPAAFVLLINALGVFLIFKIGDVLFGRTAGLLSALLYAFSFEQYQYAYYLSHPSFATVAVLLFYLGLSLVAFRKYDRGWFLAVLGLALSLHFELILLYLIPTFFLVIVLFRLWEKTRRRATIPIAMFMLFFLLSSFFVSELQYGFRATKSLLSFAMASTKNVEILPIFELFLTKYSLHGYLNVFGFSLRYSIFFLIALIIVLWRAKAISQQVRFLVVWILSPLLLYISSSQPVHFFFTNMGVSSGIILLTAFSLSKVSRSMSLKVFLIALILLGNVRLWLQDGKGGLVHGWLAVQEGMLLSDEIDVIDYTYSSSYSEPFEIKTLTMPLKIQTTWSYLYREFGLERYGYLPSSVYGDVLGFHGHFSESSPNTCLRYLISEPTRGIATWFIDEFYQEENGANTLLEEKTFGLISVQQRLKGNCEGQNEEVSLQ